MATLPTGAISLADVQNYYGGTNPISISEYYAETYQIPSSGTISLDTFRGKPSYYGDRMFAFSASSSGSAEFYLTISTTGSASSYSSTMTYAQQEQYHGQKGASNGTIALFADDYRSPTTDDDLDTGSDMVYWVSISSPATSHGYGGAGPSGLGPVLGDGASNGISALWGGGSIRVPTGPSSYTTLYLGYMHRSAISTTGSAVATGGIFDPSGGGGGGDQPEGVVSNGTRGVWTGGRINSLSYTNNMMYQTITSNSSAVTFGVLNNDEGTSRRSSLTCADARDRGLMAGGFTSTTTNRIDYITISTTGNSVNFGNLRAPMSNMSGGGNGNRCVFAGGSNNNYVDYVNPESAGNASNWGNLPANHSFGGSACGNI